jgi:ribonuclease HII
MVIAGVLIEENKERELKELGVKDSKMLTAKQREHLFPKIKELAKDIMVIEVDP